MLSNLSYCVLTVLLGRYHWHVWYVWSKERFVCAKRLVDGTSAVIYFRIRTYCSVVRLLALNSIFYFVMCSPFIYFVIYVVAFPTYGVFNERFFVISVQCEGLVEETDSFMASEGFMIRASIFPIEPRFWLTRVFLLWSHLFSQRRTVHRCIRRRIFPPVYPVRCEVCTVWRMSSRSLRQDSDISHHNAAGDKFERVGTIVDYVGVSARF